MTTIGVTASTTGSQRRASRRLFPWLDVRDCPKRTATPPRENPGRPETERLTRACQAQLSQPVSHPVHNPVRSSAAPLSPRSALFPSSPVYSPTQQQRTVLSLILNSIAVLWDNRIDTSLLRVDDLRPFDSRVQTSAKEPASVRLRNHACFDLPRGTPLLGEHFGAPKASDEHVG